MPSVAPTLSLSSVSSSRAPFPASVSSDVCVSVLLRQILGLEQPARGEIEVLGQPVADLGRRGAAARIGMLFQHGALFSAFSVIENIAFPLRELRTLPRALIRDAALVKLQMVGLKPEDADKMPADLSGGMIKRVAAAMDQLQRNGRAMACRRLAA